MTTSSSASRISEIFPAIHLIMWTTYQPGCQLLTRVSRSLFHDLDVDLSHIDLLIEFGRKFGGLEQFLIDRGHDEGGEGWGAYLTSGLSL